MVAIGVEGAVVEDSREALSERELEILRLVVTGVTNREIGVRLVISPNTVKVHLRNIFAKLGVESRTEAALVAIQNGWVEVPAGAIAEAPAGEERLPLSWGRRAFALAALAATFLLAFWPRSSGWAIGPGGALSDRGAGGGSFGGPEVVQRWSARSAMVTARERFACVAFGGRVYAIGGDTANGAVGDTAVYDPASDSWAARSVKPTATSNIGAAVLRDEIYVPGGYDGSERVLSVVEVYSPATDSWRVARPLPAPRCAYAIAVAGERLCLFGGWDGARYVPDVLIYDPQQDAWSLGTPLAQARGFAAAAVVDGRIYVAGGYDGTAESAACEVYDPALEGSNASPWKALAPMAQPRGGLGLTAAGGRLYAVGGGWNGGLTFNESYDVASNRWQPFASPILGQWRNLGVAAAQNSLGTTVYAIGGRAGERLAVNQAYRALLNVYLPGLQ